MLDNGQHPHRFDAMTLRFLTVALVVLNLFCPVGIHATPGALSEADRIALTEQLEKIQQRSKDRVGGLYQRAIQDYRRAIQSDDATMDH